MGKLIDTIPTEVTEAVADSLRLLRQADLGSRRDQKPGSQPLPSLLERCQEYLADARQQQSKPVRLIHHFACTGGTLFTKCLACSPNVQVLSELDPLSTKASPTRAFNPSDLIQLVQHGNRTTSTDEKLKLFMASFSVLYDSSVAKGLRILVRDHTHSHFCVGSTVPDRPTLKEIFCRDFQTLSVITVRHPLDSWLSLTSNRWVEFSPGTLDEYAKRYLAFLSSYPNTRRFKYEDFVRNPDPVLAEIYDELSLVHEPDYKNLFMAHRFSGDSGRSGTVIEKRTRRPVSKDLLSAAKASEAFCSLCQQLDYESLT